MDARISASIGASADAALGRLVDELTARVQRGEALDWDELARRHPEHAAELRNLVPAVAALGELSSSVGSGSTETDAEPVSGVLGDFRIVREVGRGGIGVVYEAEQISLDRRVALKVLPFAATMDPKHLQRFKNEARAAASLQHPNIVAVYGVGCERAVHFIAMQFVEGVTLAQVISGLYRPTAPATPADLTGDYVPGEGDASSTLAAAGLSTLGGKRGADFHRAAAKLIIQAAEALEYAHSLGVVHRDVKPGNLMVDSAGRLWVADFGLAKVGADAGMTMSGDLLGTLRYMSPEQAMARHGLVDHRTDVYSLGATLYELLTGRAVVTGEDKQAMLRQIAFEEPAAPRKHAPALPRDLETVVLKALEKDPRQRYAAAAELADDLKRWLEDRPVAARRPGVRAKAAKWARRHRGAVWAGAGVLLLAVAGLTAGLLITAGLNRRLG